MKQSDAYQLNMHYGDDVIGTLTQEKSANLLTLNYAQQWRERGFAISPHLPLNEEHGRTAAYNYFDNALPEGEARKLLAENLGVSEKQVYSQVRAIGRDLSGAVVFKPTHCDLAAENKPMFRLLEEQELVARLDRKEDYGLLTWDEKPRLSVAGVQDKLNVFIDAAGKMGFGDGSLCSTHILKFERKDCPNLVLNELFCMKLSRAIGLPTAEVEFRRFGAHPVLIVKRFDRNYVKDANKVLRRHVIDGCQALNLSRDHKYERNLGDGRDVAHIRDGASLPMLFEFCKQTSRPIESKQWLIHWQLFNLMISNYDSHGKNVSFYFDRQNSSFTPAYDLVNISMFPQFKHVLAMAMGDEFEPQHIHAYQLADFAETCHIDKKLLVRNLSELADNVLKQLSGDRFIKTLQDNPDITIEDQRYFRTLSDNIVARTTYLKTQAADIAGIVV
ncbi:HipA domain-containing protein [Aliidiomarina celeris]|uniref:HipA domain-containing protein n=1 Tax=Aliidiomarina celeris TaxID=2249428 RepID=UPI000DE88D6D|nr:HipA domain-containing protein [Aliidiomarina celeris]